MQDAGPSEAATHDISRVSHHVPNIKDFLATVEKATRSAFPNTGKSRYQAAHVLLLSWEDDDLGVLQQSDRLSGVFRDCYGFETEDWFIPSQNSHSALGKKLQGFAETGAKEGALLILYYGGHGFLNTDRQLVWACNRNRDAPSVTWFALQAQLLDADSDVLILLDCSSAAGTGGNSTKGTKEVIAACGFDTWAPVVGEHSFTRSLTDELLYLSTGPSFSVTSLHSRVFVRMKHWNPVYDAQEQLVVNREGRYQDKERRATPIYISLNKESNPRSIEIFSPRDNHIKGRAERKALTEARMEDTDENSVAMTNFFSDNRYQHVEVTLSVQVEAGQIVRPNDIVDWIKDMPLLAKSVRLQAVIPSMSTLLILSLPVSTWNLLPNNPACSFVGFTTSTNLLLPNQLVCRIHHLDKPTTTQPAGNLLTPLKE